MVWNDEAGYCGDAVPGFGLGQVFGCREKGAEGVDAETPVKILVDAKHPALPLLRPGDVLLGARFREALEPLSPTAEVVAEFEDGSPAIVVNRWGAGWGVFVGSLLSLGFYKFEDGNVGKVLKGLTQLAGLRKPVLVSGAPPYSVEPRLLEGTLDDERQFCIFFAFNQCGRACCGPSSMSRCRWAITL